MSVPSWALPYIDTLNGSGFFWKDCNSFNLVDHSPYMVEWDTNNHSYYTSLISQYQTNNTFPLEDVIDINIVTNGNTVSFDLTTTRTSIYMEWGTGTNYGYSDNVRFSYNSGNQNYYIQTMVLPSHDKITATLTDTQTYDTVEDVLNYLTYHYRNINIYVDGECWARVNGLTYDFESVSEVSGNGKVQSLSTLVDINNGELVETTDITKFNLDNSSNVHNIVRDIINNW